MHPLETFLQEVRAVRDSGAGVAETSYYPAVSTLLNAAGSELRPPVRCVMNLRAQGAGMPDGGLFAADQFARPSDDAPAMGQLPSRGAIEIKSPLVPLTTLATSEQVLRYLDRYGLVVVTNLRDWGVVGRDDDGDPVILERHVLAASDGAFAELLRHPRKAAAEQGAAFSEFLRLVMLRRAEITDPEQLAWILASYAREARSRAEREAEVPTLAVLRGALEDALGMKFHGERGEHFFRSTLVQTLFYGIFSAWVLWSRQGGAGRFEWRQAGWTLRVPAIRALFHQIADPDRLKRLDLVDPLEWAADALNRVSRDDFFRRFREEQAVQYFYEPFLQAFDPELRKELGVWYTPPEVVKYMVARVDTALKEELGIPDGLADERVLVLDPCCGTGAYLVEVLERIATSLRERGEDALVAAELRRAATERVFGFEILPAPFVVAHLQLGLLLQTLGASGEDEPDTRRVGVYLTNALTGWGPPADDQKAFAFPELKAEHDAAERIKHSDSILVVLGNPPYNGFPGAAFDEERDLVDAYRTTKRAAKPQGQGLNDLYVRFFRMAERRIVELTGRGVVCFISNYSWLDGLSFTGMRERYLDVFDRIWIDSLNGDKYRTGKLTPEGEPDPSVFSTEWNREGIQVGTAISLLVRTEPHEDTRTIRFRNLWGKGKREELIRSLGADLGESYEVVQPAGELGFPFAPTASSIDYLQWVSLTELLPFSSPGIQPSRDDVVVDIDRESLVARMQMYFDPSVSDADMALASPRALESTTRFDGALTRGFLVERGYRNESVVRYLYRPFDLRWLYWEPETKLLDEKRAEYVRHIHPGNTWIGLAQRHRREFDPPVATRVASSRHLIERGANLFPLYLVEGSDQPSLFESAPGLLSPNLSILSERYLDAIGAVSEDLFYFVLGMLHAPDYRVENSGALKQDWPRMPLPQTAVALAAGAHLGRALDSLLNPEERVAGVSVPPYDLELRMIAVPRNSAGDQINESADLAITVGWGHAGKGSATMAGRGRCTAREYSADERGAVEAGAVRRGLSSDQAFALIGNTCLDIYLNDRTYWQCVPSRVWEYTLGGYQVIKKWLSYREEPLLGRPLKLDEVREVTNMARRIAAILLMEPALNDCYASVKANTWDWNRASGAAGAPPRVEDGSSGSE